MGSAPARVPVAAPGGSLAAVDHSRLRVPRRDLPATVTCTGPVLPGASELPLATPGWWDELDGSRKVVHVTQGTWDNRDLGRLIGPTLRALAHRDDLLVVATTGGAPLSSIGTPIPTNARISDQLPYPRLLPRVDAMVTNGGYGGVQHALSHGVLTDNRYRHAAQRLRREMVSASALDTIADLVTTTPARAR